MSSSSSLNNLQRIANGITLIAKEIVKKTTLNPNAKDFETLVASSLKSAVVSATDLTGLTKGKVRSFSKFNNNSAPPSLSSDELSTSSSKSSSVVYFNDVEQVASSASPQPSQAEVILETEKEEEKRNVINIEADLVHKVAEDVKSNEVPKEITTAVVKRRKPRERRVPTTPFSRAMGFAGLGAGLVWGTIQESTNRLIYGTDNSQNNQSAISPFLSEKNAERLANALCRMRGAALKLGQMLSIQDESLVPAPILAALDIVRQGADVMPRKQLNQVLDAELGTDWSSKLRSFDYEPLAAASIGQVHRAVMKDGTEVAMKIQYPGVADSIESDIENVKLLLDYTNLIPKGLYLDRAMKVAKEELSRECDYLVEATNQKRFRELLSDTAGFYVPIVVDEVSSKRVLTTELVAGVPIDKVASLDQSTRNHVGTKLLELTLKELFVFRFMQTDPNWGNFLYDNATRTINLIDFGAARDYPKQFVDDYLQMVMACANNDRETSIEMSKRLRFLTGMESEVMLDAHVQAGFVVGLPFSKPGGFDFRSTNITQSVSNLGARMLKHRLTPPPDEAYSLHRKLSGAFLACIKLGAVVPCRELLLDVYEHYKFGDDSADLLSSSSTA